jgi:hypothetical protein
MVPMPTGYYENSKTNPQFLTGSNFIERWYQSL